MIDYIISERPEKARERGGKSAERRFPPLDKGKYGGYTKPNCKKAEMGRSTLTCQIQRGAGRCKALWAGSGRSPRSCGFEESKSRRSPPLSGLSAGLFPNSGGTTDSVRPAMFSQGDFDCPNLRRNEKNGV